jgi:hypothetical protein
MLLLFCCAACGQKRLDHVNGSAEALAPAKSGDTQQVKLKLMDGSSISADEAWETEQGIW